MKIEKYLKAIKARLNLPPELRDRVISDLETSIAARREAGEGEEEILVSLGTPKVAAKQLNGQMAEFAYRKSPWRFACLVIAVLAGLWFAAMACFPATRYLVSGGAGAIGGADGPTAIFITGPAEIPWQTLFMSGMLVLMGLMGFFMLRKCPPPEKKQ